jgi:hypothetical protein
MRYCLLTFSKPPFWSAAILLAVIEIMHMIRKGQHARQENCAQRSRTIRCRNNLAQSSGLDAAR